MMKLKILSVKGFSLSELMIGLFLSSLISIALFIIPNGEDSDRITIIIKRREWKWVHEFWGVRI